MKRLTLLLLLIVAAGSLAAGQTLRVSSVTQRRLHHVEIGDVQVPDPLRVVVGDMLQLQPFWYPVMQKFIDAKLVVELKGDRALELIGQSRAAKEDEGRSSVSVFLYVVAKGRSEVALKLVSANGKDIPGYRVSYRVESKMK